MDKCKRVGTSVYRGHTEENREKVPSCGHIWVPLSLQTSSSSVGEKVQRACRHAYLNIFSQYLLLKGCSGFWHRICRLLIVEKLQTHEALVLRT
jgi:hypothetical protein